MKTEDKREDRNLVVDEPNQERLASAAVEDENQGDEDAEIDPLESSAPKFKELFKDETMYNRFIEFYEVNLIKFSPKLTFFAQLCSPPISIFSRFFASF